MIDAEKCNKKYIDVFDFEGVWTLCKNLVDPDLHASTTSEHTVGTLCPYMQTDRNSISSAVLKIIPSNTKVGIF